MQRPNVEIMSPVGSFESLMAAIQGGAGSVYFGLGSMNMRSRSSMNFSPADLQEIVNICNRHQLKTYLTLNTVIYDGELEEMRHFVDVAAQAGVTAIIASDPAVLQYARVREMEIHISTQCNISNIEAVKWYARFADVMVLARELSLGQVKHIISEIRKQSVTGPSGELVKIEVFVHGALCMAVSGKCYLSLHGMNSSANRGACLQLCRRSYEVTDKETGLKLEVDNQYIMSPKDLNTISILDQILAAGVGVLKIEGRGRSPEYVKTVTRVYREAVESCFDGSFSHQKTEKWNNELKSVYNRGFWEGYYLDSPTGEWSRVYGSQATTRKRYLGKVTNFFPKISVAEVKLETGALQSGARYTINGPTTGVVEGQIEEIRLEYDAVAEAVKGQVCSFRVNETVRRGDKLYLVEENPI
jgi:putative protease